jgi:hypothetical protein
MRFPFPLGTPLTQRPEITPLTCRRGYVAICRAYRQGITSWRFYARTQTKQ